MPLGYVYVLPITALLLFLGRFGIFIPRGVYHCSFCCNGSLRASNSGMSRVWLPLFFLYDIKTAIMESDGCESDR